MLFRDRRDGGRRLAVLLEPWRHEDPVILGLARGGVPVAFEVARYLDAPLDVMVARKIGAPGHEEYAIGALAGGVLRLDEVAIAELDVPRSYIMRQLAVEMQEISRRQAAYRGGRPPLDLTGKTVILVDDGLATGLTAAAAIEALRTHGPRRIVLAVPVCAPERGRELRRLADDVVCVQAPPAFTAVGIWYEDFRPTEDAEVMELLEAGTRQRVGR